MKWNSEYYYRNAPATQTIYKIKNKLEEGDGVESKKKGQKKKSVITQEKKKKLKMYLMIVLLLSVNLVILLNFQNLLD